MVILNSYEMTLESDCDCNVVGDWLKNLTPLFNQREAKPKPIAFFHRFEQVKSNRYEF